ncbi:MULTISPECIES: hypothetical protein [Pseudoalteromonas]|uniref:hypothetical protein n=1 Tax=Pseudoalteromonas TaxID=53246 RepID=UPI00030EA372|nr:MULTISPECIES: hypothetical protein [Pseudoalteromonas]MCF6145984.1 hypothetical protein [Pseudoalteromonas mariniglutinosa NCIMB 1770]
MNLNVVYSVGYGVVSRGSLLLINFIAVKLLTGSEFGEFSYLLSIVSSLATFVAFGCSVTTNTVFSKYADDITLKSKTLCASISFTFLLVLGLFLLTLPYLKGELVDISSDNSFFILFVALMTLIGFSGVYEGALYGSSKYKTLFAYSIVTFILFLPLAIYLVDTYAVIGGLLAVAVFRLLFNAFGTFELFFKSQLAIDWRFFFCIDKSVFKIFKSLSAPSILGAMMVAPAITMTLGLLNEFNSSKEEIAYFSWVYQVYLVAIFIPSSLSGYYISTLSKKGGNVNVMNIMGANLIFSTVVVAFLFICKGLILKLAGEEYYINASEIFNYLIPCVILYSLNAAFGSYWPATNKAWFGFALNFLWAVTVLAFSYLLIPSSNGVGIAVALNVAYGLLLLVQFILWYWIEKHQPVSSEE